MKQKKNNISLLSKPDDIAQQYGIQAKDISGTNEEFEFPTLGVDMCYKYGRLDSPCELSFDYNNNTHCPSCWIRSSRNEHWYCFEKIDNSCEVYMGSIDILQNSKECPELCNDG